MSKLKIKNNDCVAITFLNVEGEINIYETSIEDIVYIKQEAICELNARNEYDEQYILGY